MAEQLTELDLKTMREIALSVIGASPKENKDPKISSTSVKSEQKKKPVLFFRQNKKTIEVASHKIDSAAHENVALEKVFRITPVRKTLLHAKASKNRRRVDKLSDDFQIKLYEVIIVMSLILVWVLLMMWLRGVELGIY